MYYAKFAYHGRDVIRFCGVFTETKKNAVINTKFKSH